MTRPIRINDLFFYQPRSRQLLFKMLASIFLLALIASSESSPTRSTLTFSKLHDFIVHFLFCMAKLCLQLIFVMVTGESLATCSEINPLDQCLLELLNDMAPLFLTGNKKLIVLKLHTASNYLLLYIQESLIWVFLSWSQWQSTTLPLTWLMVPFLQFFPVCKSEDYRNL